MKLDVSILDSIVNNTIAVIEDSKGQILEIAEHAVTEVERVQAELDEVQREAAQIIQKVDETDQKYKQSRLRLMEVSKDFRRFTEADIKAAYERAQELQIALVKLGEREKSLRYRRDHLERSFKRLMATRQKAESLVSQVAIVLNYLGSDLRDLSGHLDEIMQSEKMRFHIIETMEEERRRVAREIHDGPAQSMANLAMRTDYCLRLLEVEPESLGSEMQLLQLLVRDCLAEVRQIMFDLRPMVLDDLGLMPALKKYLEQFRGRHGLEVELQCLGAEQRLHRTSEVALFRVVQEALNNVLKHAGPCQALVKIEFLADRFNLLLRDNGRGFNVSEVLDDKGSERFGLTGIRERVRLLGGEVRFFSVPGTGTTVIVSVPLG
ncbi:MAG: sensor histidine kinase [Candidatus Desulforudis sp.]|nr:sensor histidine kinase [Desulforudis sp.]